ncbi:hypothetical protein F5148DRAFT_251361 [Russula earlei]|uniref:Uncharacterized protein n=1 Tax=Russula earlei TaxID=71964 RepID=A0ACC0U3R2_9AGAM|nr:hypothetical protein F5148DRAFT_251361 [Russula earlei]
MRYRTGKVCLSSLLWDSLVALLGFRNCLLWQWRTRSVMDGRCGDGNGERGEKKEGSRGRSGAGRGKGDAALEDERIRKKKKINKKKENKSECPAQLHSTASTQRRGTERFWKSAVRSDIVEPVLGFPFGKTLPPPGQGFAHRADRDNAFRLCVFLRALKAGGAPNGGIRTNRIGDCRGQGAHRVR